MYDPCVDPEEINLLVASLLMFIGACLAILWGIPSHCGTTCPNCRPKGGRRH